jgi:ApaG protein
LNKLKLIILVEKITKGIKISVHTNYEGVKQHNDNSHYAFSYFVTIENQTNDIVQLLSRQWEIFNSLNDIEVVIGDGVVGQIPILEPNEKYTYRSNCFLESSMGSMKGFFNMVNFTSKTHFKVQIPTFQLIVNEVLN